MPHLRINQSFIERPFVLFEMTNALIFLNLLEHALDGAEKKITFTALHEVSDGADTSGSNTWARILYCKLS